jgi:O-antigen ligase
MQTSASAKIFTLLSGITTVAIAFTLPISTAVMTVLFNLLPVFVLCRGDLKGNFSCIANNRVALLFFVFFSLFVIGLSYTSASFGDGLDEIIKYDKFFLGLFLFPVFADEKWRKYALYAFITAVIIILLMSYSRAFIFPHPNDLFYPAAIFKSPITVNLFLAFAAFWFMQKVFQGGRFHLLPFIMLALLIYDILFLSTGRSGYFVFISLLLLFLWQKLSWKGLLIFCLAVPLLVGTAYIFSYSFQTRVKEIQNNIIEYKKGNENTSVGLRIEFAKNSLYLLKKHPLIGTGTGSFTSEYAKTGTLTKTQNPHNEYLNIGVQFGVVGLLILLMMFFLEFRLSRYLPEDLKYLARGLVVAFAIGCLANSWLLDTTEGHFFVYFSALIFAALPAKRRFRDFFFENDKP